MDTKFARGTVLEIEGRNAKVDYAGGITVRCEDTCFPRPNDTLLMRVEGEALIGVATFGGARPMERP